MNALLFATLVLGQSTSHPGFSHNDYEQPRPLLEAWEQGFRYVEADVFLVEGDLLVAHDRKDLRPERSLESLYLKPLSKLVSRSGTSTPFWLMVDIKADGPKVYEALDKLLTKYEEMIVKWTDQGPGKGRVAVVLSGDRPVSLVAAKKERRVAIDGRPEDLVSNPPPGLVPWVSTSYLGFKWPLEGASSLTSEESIKSYVKTAHGQKRLVRFWAIPDTAAAWRMQVNLGIDIINTDRPRDFKEWFSAQRKGSFNRSLTQ